MIQKRNRLFLSVIALLLCLSFVVPVHAQTIEPRERIAQMVIAPYIIAEFNEADTLSDTLRGEGGFGSTGTK